MTSFDHGSDRIMPLGNSLQKNRLLRGGKKMKRFFVIDGLQCSGQAHGECLTPPMVLFVSLEQPPALYHPLFQRS